MACGRINVRSESTI